MQDLLYVKECHRPLFCTEKHDDKRDEQWSIIQRQVCGFIRQWIEIKSHMLNHIESITDDRTLWNKLESLYKARLERRKYS